MWGFSYILNIAAAKHNIMLITPMVCKLPLLVTIRNITIIMVNITIFINRRWLSACGWARQVLWYRVYNRGSNNLLLGEGHTFGKAGGNMQTEETIYKSIQKGPSQGTL